MIRIRIGEPVLQEPVRRKPPSSRRAYVYVKREEIEGIRMEVEGKKIESGGILLGEFCVDERRFLLIDGSIHAENSEKREASIIFTEDTWKFFLDELELSQRNLVGWYHSHPGYGVWLSPQDRWVHDSFFLNWQVALVFDSSGKFGFFKDGKEIEFLLV
jgi:proteasome lid subunit RPN8/RPN11